MSRVEEQGFSMADTSGNIIDLTVNSDDSESEEQSAEVLDEYIEMLRETQPPSYSYRSQHVSKNGGTTQQAISLSHSKITEPNTAVLSVPDRQTTSNGTPLIIVGNDPRTPQPNKDPKGHHAMLSQLKSFSKSPTRSDQLSRVGAKLEQTPHSGRKPKKLSAAYPSILAYLDKTPEKKASLSIKNKNPLRMPMKATFTNTAHDARPAKKSKTDNFQDYSVALWEKDSNSPKKIVFHSSALATTPNLEIDGPKGQHEVVAEPSQSKALTSDKTPLTHTVPSTSIAGVPGLMEIQPEALSPTISKTLTLHEKPGLGKSIPFIHYEPKVKPSDQSVPMKLLGAVGQNMNAVRSVPPGDNVMSMLDSLTSQPDTGPLRFAQDHGQMREVCKLNFPDYQSKPLGSPSLITVKSTNPDRVALHNQHAPLTGRRLSTSSFSTSDSANEMPFKKRKRRKSNRISSSRQSPFVRDRESQTKATTLRPTVLEHGIATLSVIDKTKTSTYPSYSRGTMLRYRDIGGPSLLNSTQSLMRIRDSCLDTTIKPWRNWTGASKDIMYLAWAPNGLSFAAGSTTDMDILNERFNRPNNLLWCNMTDDTIVELDDHKIERLKAGPDSSQADSALAFFRDSHVYATISDICFGSDSNRFYTASHDKTVKFWDSDPDDGFPRCINSIEHTDEVSHFARCNVSTTEILASAQRSKRSAIHVFESSSPHLFSVLESDQTEKHNLIPTSLVWGHPGTGTGSLLAAGYGDESTETIARLRGDILVWDLASDRKVVDLSSRLQCVYDLAWHTQVPWLVAAMNAKLNKYAGLRGTQSNIKIWSPKQRAACVFDLDCPALDINSLLLHPLDVNYVSAACTDGNIYHYDLRNPQTILAKLEHGASIAELDNEKPRETEDDGVHFVSWNAAGTLIYSGSSDGKIKQWNPYLNGRDAFVTDIATFDAGISNGRFSPDFTNLLIGTTKGSIHVLSSAPVTPWVYEERDRLRNGSKEHLGDDEMDQEIEKCESIGGTSFTFLSAVDRKARLGTVDGVSDLSSVSTILAS